MATSRPTTAQRRYLCRGLKQPGGKLPLFDEHGQQISVGNDPVLHTPRVGGTVVCQSDQARLAGVQAYRARSDHRCGWSRASQVMLVGTLGHVLIPGLIFLAIHILVSATPLRGVAVRAVGQRVYLALFSLVSLAAFIWLILAYREAPFISIWYLPALAWVGIIVMPFAFIGAIAGNTTSSRAKSGTGSTNDDPSDVAVGVFKITRHPFLWSVVLWSGAHLLVNGDLASLIMFGTFLALGLVGPHSSDAKRRKKDPEAWRRIAAETSYVPFAAILSGRASVTPGEIGWWRILLGVALYAVFLAGHGWIFGAPILG